MRTIVQKYSLARESVIHKVYNSFYEYELDKSVHGSMCLFLNTKDAET